MKLIQFSLLLLTFSFFVLFIPAQGIVTDQNGDFSKQETEVLEQILVDAEKLKLPLNRAWIYSQVGKYVWKTDEKRARKLFEQSINELITAQDNTEPSENYSSGFSYFNYVRRRTIIKMLIYLDSELAYKYLLKSRPKKLSQSFADFKKASPSSTKNQEIKVPHLEEFHLEREIKLSIAQKKPDRAIEFINEDLRYGIEEDTLKLLKFLYEINPVIANELTEKSVEKLLLVKLFDSETQKLTRNRFNYYYRVPMSFLSALGKDNPNELYPMSVSNETLKKLADKISKHLVDGNFTTENIYALRTIQRFFPNRVAELEQKKAQISQDPRTKENLIFKELVESNPSNEELLNAGESLSVSYQRQIYTYVACRLANEEKFAETQKFLYEKYGNENSANTQLFGILNALTTKAISENRFAYAETAIKQIPHALFRSQGYINLAVRIYLENPQKNKTKALSFLNQAEFELKQNAQNINQFNYIAMMLTGYSIVDTNKAFENLNIYIDQINLFVKDRLETQHKSPLIVKDGEIIVSELGNNFNPRETIRNLKKADYSQTVKIINKLQNPELRISFKFILLRENNYSIFSGTTTSPVCPERILRK